jgi:hypothetical protein
MAGRTIKASPIEDQTYKVHVFATEEKPTRFPDVMQESSNN